MLRNHQTSRARRWTLASAAALLLLLATPPTLASGTIIDGDCTGYNLAGTEADSPVPSTGLLRLACPSMRIECDLEPAEGCRAGIGVISVVGGAFCGRPLGPLPPALSEPCAALVDGIAAIIDSTQCSTATPVGDERWEPGMFTLVRQYDDGSIAWEGVVSCGEREARCRILVMPDQPNPLHAC